MATIKFKHLVNHVDVIQLLTHLGLEFDGEWSGRYWTTCVLPDHQDSNPSFAVDPENGRWFCFGCRRYGDLASLIMEITPMDFPQTMDYVKEFAGLKDATVSELLDQVEQNVQIIEQAHDRAIGIGFRNSRTYSGRQTNFKPVFYPLGTEFWTQEVINFCAQKGIDYNQIKPYFQLGFCRFGDYFNRIIIPIWFQQKLVDLQARDYTGKEQRKDLFIKGIPIGHYLFNFDNIDWSSPVVIVESALDVMRLWPYYTNSVAVMGSALSEPQAELLRSASVVYIMPDNDSGGRALLASVKAKLVGREMWLRYFDKENVPNLLSRMVKIT